jgi:FtsZ-binding cell division protein ZapB
MVEILIAILGAIILLAVTALWDRATKASQVKTALETISLQQAQVTALKDENHSLRSRVDQLEAALKALQELVTQAAPVQEVKLLLQAHDRQVSEALGRIEHKLNS